MVAPARRRTRRGLLLTHGAGGDSRHHTLLAIEDAVAPMAVRRMDFPYRREGRRAPDRAPRLLEALVAEIADFCAADGVAERKLVLGGRSMGGRICSLAVAEGQRAAGLLLLSYPLHPPGRPDRLRSGHFGRLDLPCLFVSGTRDPFGSPEELTRAAEEIPGPVTFVWLDGRRHDPAGVDADIVAAVRTWLADPAVRTR